MNVTTGKETVWVPRPRTLGEMLLDQASEGATVPQEGQPVTTLAALMLERVAAEMAAEADATQPATPQGEGGRS